MSFKIQVEDLDRNSGSYYTDESIPVAACMAVQSSWTITNQAFIVGVVAWAITENIFEGKAAEILRDWLARHAPRPDNMRGAIALALDEKEPE